MTAPLRVGIKDYLSWWTYSSQPFSRRISRITYLSNTTLFKVGGYKVLFILLSQPFSSFVSRIICLDKPLFSLPSPVSFSIWHTWNEDRIWRPFWHCYILRSTHMRKICHFFSICELFGRIYSALTVAVAYANILHNAAEKGSHMRKNTHMPKKSAYSKMKFATIK